MISNIRTARLYIAALFITFSVFSDKAYSADPIIYGISDRLGQTTAALSHKLFGKFSLSIDREARFLSMPLRRLNRQLDFGEVDILLYSDERIGKGRIRSSQHIGVASLLVISRATVDIFDPQYRGIGIRGDAIHTITGQKTPLTLVENSDQGVRMLLAKRADYLLEWDNEIYQRYPPSNLKDLGLNVQILINEVKLYPAMLENDASILLMEKFDSWVQTVHQNGELLEIFKAHNLERAYPFPIKNVQDQP